MRRTYLTASAMRRCRQAHSADGVEVGRRDDIRRRADACKPQESVMTKLENRCSYCGGKIGLLCYHHLGPRFCRKDFKGNLLAEAKKGHASMRRWLGFLPDRAPEAAAQVPPPAATRPPPPSHSIVGERPRLIRNIEAGRLGGAGAADCGPDRYRI